MAEPRSPDSAEGRGGGKGAEVELIRALVNKLLALGTLVRQGRAETAEGLLAAEAFARVCIDALAGGVALTLEVGTRTISYRGVEVAGGDLISRQMVEGLFGQGLRSVTVEPGARAPELASLGQLLGTDWTHRSALDDDLEARAWQLGFEAVHFDIATREVVGEDDDSVPAEEMVRRLIRQLGATDIQDDLGMLDIEVAGLMDELAALGGQGGHPPPLREGPELSQLQRLLDQVRVGKDIDDARMGKLFFEVLRATTEPAAIRRGVEALLGHCRRLLTTGAVEEVGPMLRRLLSLAEADTFGGWEGRAALLDGLRGLYAPELCEALRYGWERRPDAKAWAGLLFSIGAASPSTDIAAVAALGMVSPDREVRQALADGLLLTLERENLSAKDALHSAPDDVLPIILLVLRRRPEPMLLEGVLAKATSANAEVREAALVALRDHQSPRTREIMRVALGDEAQAVRVEALRYLTVYRDAEAATVVAERLRTATDATCEASELRALAMAHGVLGKEKAVAELEKMAIPVEKPRHQGLVIAALHGLRAAGAPGKAALERLGRTTPALREELHKILGGAA